MSYKLKSLLYLLAFVASALLYYAIDANEDNARDAKIASSAEINSANTAVSDIALKEEAMLLK